jgi:hypothetical protein
LWEHAAASQVEEMIGKEHALAQEEVKVEVVNQRRDDLQDASGQPASSYADRHFEQQDHSWDNLKVEQQERSEDNPKVDHVLLPLVCPAPAPLVLILIVILPTFVLPVIPQ